MSLLFLTRRFYFFFFFQHFKYMIPLPLTSMVSVEKFVSYWGYVVPEKALLSCCFQYFLFVSKIWLYLCVVLFEFSMLGICWASQKCRFIFPIKWGQFSTIISSNKLPPLLSFFVSLHLALFVLLFWDSENIYVSLLDSAPQPPPLYFVYFYSLFFLTAPWIRHFQLPYL